MSETRDKILEMLKNADGSFVSSREICAALKTSRTAVWKHIHTLQEQGYQVEAITNKGYRIFMSEADMVTSHEIREAVGTGLFGKRVAYFELLDSTNNMAKKLADAGAEEGTLIIANEQSAGRGRLNRAWISPPKSGVLMSLIIRPPLSIAEAPRITSLAAVAVAQALMELSGKLVQIKWPNDILFEGKKISGILTEVSAEGNMVQYAIVGVGINTGYISRLIPESLQPTVVSLEEVTGKRMKRAQVVANVLSNMEKLYEGFIHHGEFAGIIDYIKTHSATLGRYVKVDVGSRMITGFAEDIADDGALVLRVAGDQIQKVYSGDVIATPMI